VEAALRKGKHVFVEKPLAINRTSLDQLRALYANLPDPVHTLTVGYNRRWSPHTQAVKERLSNQPLHLIATMNVGFIPADHWVHDPEVGGGRILGEACHYVDLCAYLAGSPIVSVMMSALGTHTDLRTDNASIQLTMANGSNATIHYVSNGHRAYPKERIEVHQQGRSLVIDNFRQTQAFGALGFKGLKTRIDKGHRAQFAELIRRIQHGGEALIPFDHLLNTSSATLAALESLQPGTRISV
jgi:predicted dehydrogenase